MHPMLNTGVHSAAIMRGSRIAGMSDCIWSIRSGPLRLRSNRGITLHISCLHTAQVHVATFDTLFAAMPHVTVQHVVRPDLLEQARDNGLETVRKATQDALADLSEADAVLCTCSTLGPLVQAPHLRIDRPAMQAAVELGPNILVAICLESTRTATLDLLSVVATEAGRDVTPRLVLCDKAWVHFEANNQPAFAASIADRIAAEIEANGAPDCVLLAQASMSVAAPLIVNDVPVLTTPQMAVDAAIKLATK